MGVKLIKEIYLGVIDFPYDYSSNNTTGKIATILENKYGILQKFIERYQNDAVIYLKTALVNFIQDTINHQEASDNSFQTAFSQIEHEMKKFLSSQEVERVGMPNVPTQAALKGISHRFKRNRKIKQKMNGQRRPSFIDTGLMESSYKVWGTFE